jgi:preprotein translocase subunit SecG
LRLKPRRTALSDRSETETVIYLQYALYAVHVLVCIFLILVVLLQQGKGADLSVFGGGSTQTAFGARGATTLLHKLTVGSFVIFIVTTVAISVSQSKIGGSSLVSGVDGAKTKSSAPAPAKAAPAPAPAKAAPAAPVTPAPKPATPGTPAPAPAAPPAH